MNPILQTLARYESRNVTFIEPDGSWPIVWDLARGVYVWDTDGKRYLDLTAAFGVANAGHANPRVVRAAIAQAKRLLHAMGDVHPHPRKAELVRKLSQITFERWTKHAHTGRTILGNSGFEAVEAALKTALLYHHSTKPKVIVFEGGYHGLGYGALNATHRKYFREPFLPQLRRFGHAIPFPTHPGELDAVEAEILASLASGAFNAILVEPVQGRGGIRVPPPEFLPLLRRLADQFDVLLILDEIYTGFGRTGKLFACEHSHVVPDLICLGKALTGGFPLSACVGRADLIDRVWPPSQGEALHTSTFLGHPVGCAMALAQIEEVSAVLGAAGQSAKTDCLAAELTALKAPTGYTLEIRGIGLMAGVEIHKSDGAPATEATLRIVRNLLRRGFIVLPEGDHGNVIAFSPPLTITIAQLRGAVRALARELAALA